ncbi:LolA family protein [Georgenia yuyongxinii]|uniref:Outer membrane lipoprotein carrier protein LolA n=1 Tax=Georgenia yuyongxinii TaxID=2589797 RepID=A0A552WSD6_9MICO|nr:outer membrane lipoprotein carrier protein LolA [Georgenia yuyongxinii]TRW45634.1 outer membrane lipoprotein carrier protein LolA [Georgenia yuyongxinii]
MARSWSRWVPAAAVPVVVVSAALISQAGAATDLPDKSAAELLTMVGEHSVEAFSGSFEQTADLGLPQLPDGVTAGAGGDEAAQVGDLLALLSGSRSGRLYVGGPDQARLQVMSDFAEQDVIRNGTDVWLYDSKENAATHATVPEHDGARPDAPAGAMPTPEEVADHLLAAVDPSTEVTVGADTTVAGRPAYELVLTPRTDATLVESVAISVDAETGMPLGVSVRARGQSDPAFEVAYTSLDLGAPDPSRFEFTPPPGATVTEKDLTHDGADWAPSDGSGSADAAPDHGTTPPPGQGATGPEPTLLGTGWDAVVVLPAGGPSPTDEPLLDQLTTAVDGGRLLSTALVNVLVTDDGRVLAGSVPLERLQAAATE